MDNYKRFIESIKESKKEIIVLQKDNEVIESINSKYKINKESLLGTIINYTGGVVVENWIRVYGGGALNFLERNSIYPYSNIIVAEDILGGLFSVLENGDICYFAPDCLEWEAMDISFSQLIDWILNGDTDTFYIDYRWEHWREEIKEFNINSGISFYPFLWAKADLLEDRYRKEVPISEIIELEFEFLEQYNQGK